ncbi:hypothetical protein ACFL38_03135 [Candidatus Omnitrophota bacterium]
MLNPKNKYYQILKNPKSKIQKYFGAWDLFGSIGSIGAWDLAILD